jgi:Streptomyces sporulation and cell division protein, SsgA
MDLIRAKICTLLSLPESRIPLPAIFCYDPSSPWAVSVSLLTGGEEPVVWEFARSLLAMGMITPAGEGDVHIAPSLSGLNVEMRLSSRGQSALIIIPGKDLHEFLARACAAVPGGAESEFSDLDSELSMFLWRNP